jgi:hypothetical protein
MDFGGWVQSWLNVTTRPGEAAFAEERTKPHASLQTALIWVSGAALITGVLSWLSARMALAQLGSMETLQDLIGQAGIPPEALAQLDQIPFFTGVTSIWGVLGGIVASIIGFLIFVGLLHLVARLLGGTGSYQMYAYLMATIWVPLSIVSGIIGLVPLVGGCLGFIVTIYELILAYYATRVEQNLTQGRAIIVVLTPLLIGLCLLGCVIAVGLSAIGALVNMGQ